MEPVNQSVFLKIKIMSLASEAIFIRKHENKARGRYHSQVAHGYEPTYDHGYEAHLLERHRKGVVRPEARESLIAYGYLRGKKYSEVEQNPQWIWGKIASAPLKSNKTPDWKNVASIITRFGNKRVTPEEVEAWARSSAEERLSHKELVAGSIPAEPTKI